jgi:hypothetical protein
VGRLRQLFGAVGRVLAPFPKTTALGPVAPPPAVVLSALSLSNTAATVGTAFSATIQGRTSGSTISATSSDGTALAVSGSTVSGMFGAAGTPTISLVETLSGATGSPKTTTVQVQVAAVPPSTPTGGTLDFSDPANSGYHAAL